MQLKTAFQLSAMALVFAIVPFENRILLFHTTSDQLFGEMLVYEDKVQRYFVTKNHSEVAVLFVDQTCSLLTMRMDNGESYSQSNSSEQFPMTYGIVIDNSAGTTNRRHKIKVGSAQPIEAGPLNIRTAAQMDRDFLIFIIVMVIAVSFVYLAKEYDFECQPQFEGKE